MPTRPCPRLAVAVCILWTSSGCAFGAADDTEKLLKRIQLPPGFSISVYTGDVPGARSMALSPSGILYVGTRRGEVYAVVDKDGDHRAEKVYVVDSGLDMPNGVAWRKGALYVAEVSRILRYDNIDDRLDDPPKPVVLSDHYPTDHGHGWKFIRFGPDG